MKKRYIIGIFIGSVLFCSCAKASALGPDVSLERDYVLPQGKSPQADGRIVDLYEKYGSYFLYDFTLLDLNWNQVANSTSYKLALGDPAYAGDMLDLLDEVWLQFYPEEFLKKNLPYRIFMADTIYQVLSYMDRPMECVKTGDNSLAFGYMNADTKKKTATEKLALKNTVQTLFLICCRYGRSYQFRRSFTRSVIIRRKRVLTPMMMITHVNGDSWQTLNTGMNGVLTLIGRQRRCYSRMI